VSTIQTESNCRTNVQLILRMQAKRVEKQLLFPLYYDSFSRNRWFFYNPGVGGDQSCCGYSRNVFLEKAVLSKS